MHNFYNHVQEGGTIDRHLPLTEGFLEKRGIRTTRAKFSILHENFPLQMSSWKLLLLDEAEKLLFIVEYHKIKYPETAVLALPEKKLLYFMLT